MTPIGINIDRFLTHLDEAIPKPTVRISESGEGYLRWRSSTAELVMYFPEEGGYGYAMLMGDRFVEGQTDVLDCSEQPKDLINYLKSNEW